MLRLSSHLRTVINQDGGVILDVRQGTIFRCNATAAAILELLAKGYDEEQITIEFSRLCEISRLCAQADVRGFLASLASRGLLRDEPCDC